MTRPSGDPRAELAAPGAVAHLIALAGLPSVGPRMILRWERSVGAMAAWEAICAGDVGAVRAMTGPGVAMDADRVRTLADATRGIDPSDVLEQHLSFGLQAVALGDPAYPPRLALDPSPPPILFALGDLGVLACPTVAIVGTRNATRAGRELAESFGLELARAGVAVVSGLALGIDGAGHRGVLRALDASDEGRGWVGRPVGVVAAGLDITYPRRHADLHREVARQGALISETPLGVRPTEWRFPARNRIIAGLADAVVVVESRSTGGSMLTAGEALDRNVPVLAVPGFPGAPASAGTNDLLFDGAIIARAVDDVLDAIGVAPAEVQAAPDTPVESLPTNGEAVLRALGREPSSLGELLARSSLTLDDLATALTRLEAIGLVVRSGSWFERAGAGRAER